MPTAEARQLRAQARQKLKGVVADEPSSTHKSALFSATVTFIMHYLVIAATVLIGVDYYQDGFKAPMYALVGVFAFKSVTQIVMDATCFGRFYFFWADVMQLREVLDYGFFLHDWWQKLDKPWNHPFYRPHVQFMSVMTDVPSLVIQVYVYLLERRISPHFTTEQTIAMVLTGANVLWTFVHVYQYVRVDKWAYLYLVIKGSVTTALRVGIFAFLVQLLGYYGLLAFLVSYLFGLALAYRSIRHCRKAERDTPLQFPSCEFLFAHQVALHSMFTALPWAPTYSVLEWWHGYVLSDTKMSIEHGIGLAIMLIGYKRERDVTFYSIICITMFVILANYTLLFFVNMAVSRYTRRRSQYTTRRIVGMFSRFCTALQERITGEAQPDGGCLLLRELSAKQRAVAEERAAADKEAMDRAIAEVEAEWAEARARELASAEMLAAMGEGEAYYGEHPYPVVGEGVLFEGNLQRGRVRGADDDEYYAAESDDDGNGFEYGGYGDDADAGYEYGAPTPDVNAGNEYEGGENFYTDDGAAVVGLPARTGSMAMGVAGVMDLAGHDDDEDDDHALGLGASHDPAADQSTVTYDDGADHSKESDDADDIENAILIDGGQPTYTYDGEEGYGAVEMMPMHEQVLARPEATGRARAAYSYDNGIDDDDDGDDPGTEAEGVAGHDGNEEHYYDGYYGEAGDQQHDGQGDGYYGDGEYYEDGAHEGDGQGYYDNGYDQGGYEYDGQGYDGQGYGGQEGYDGEYYADQGNYEGQGYDNHGHGNHGYGNQGYSNQGYGNQGYSSQGYGNRGYGNQGYEGQGYQGQEYDNQGHGDQHYDQQGYDDEGYDHGAADNGHYNTQKGPLDSPQSEDDEDGDVTVGSSGALNPNRGDPGFGSSSFGGSATSYGERLHVPAAAPMFAPTPGRNRATILGGRRSLSGARAAYSDNDDLSMDDDDESSDSGHPRLVQPKFPMSGAPSSGRSGGSGLHVPMTLAASSSERGAGSGDEGLIMGSVGRGLSRQPSAELPPVDENAGDPDL